MADQTIASLEAIYIPVGDASARDDNSLLCTPNTIDPCAEPRIVCDKVDTIFRELATDKRIGTALQHTMDDRMEESFALVVSKCRQYEMISSKPIACRFLTAQWLAVSTCLVGIPLVSFLVYIGAPSWVFVSSIILWLAVSIATCTWCYVTYRRLQKANEEPIAPCRLFPPNQRTLDAFWSDPVQYAYCMGDEYGQLNPPASPIPPYHPPHSYDVQNVERWLGAAGPENIINITFNQIYMHYDNKTDGRRVDYLGKAILALIENIRLTQYTIRRTHTPDIVDAIVASALEVASLSQ